MVLARSRGNSSIKSRGRSAPGADRRRPAARAPRPRRRARRNSAPRICAGGRTRNAMSTGSRSCVRERLERDSRRLVVLMTRCSTRGRPWRPARGARATASPHSRPASASRRRFVRRRTERRPACDRRAATPTSPRARPLRSGSTVARRDPSNRGRNRRSPRSPSARRSAWMSPPSPSTTSDSGAEPALTPRRIACARRYWV